MRFVLFNSNTTGVTSGVGTANPSLREKFEDSTGHQNVNRLIDLIDFLCFNATFSNISWRPVLVEEEAGVPGENHRPWASDW
jgi:hypothetical protein